MKKYMLATILLVLVNLSTVVQSEEIFGFDGVFYRVDEQNKTLYPIEFRNVSNLSLGLPVEKDESFQSQLDGFGAEAGDIIFGSSGSGWWAWQTGHVGILEKDADGNFYAREAYPQKGVQSISISEFVRDYDTVRVYRVMVASQDQRRAAAERALGYSGSYDLSAEIWDDTKWYCSKLVWRAYAYDHIYVGLDCPDRSWPCVDVSPCDIVKNEGVNKLGDLISGPFDCSYRWCGC